MASTLFAIAVVPFKKKGAGNKEVDNLIFGLEEIVYINTESRQVIDAFFAGAPKNAPPKASNSPSPDSPTLDKQ